ncbi:MAG: hypothetical protein PQJ60_01700 [Spirochaetales bacterium]|nr:hypothetical protein [Spirochaetales bacterium]
MPTKKVVIEIFLFAAEETRKDRDFPPKFHRSFYHGLSLLRSRPECLDWF